MNRVFSGRVASQLYRSRHVRRCFCNSTASELSNCQANQEFGDIRDKPNSTDTVPQYDVAIVGGGMVGISLACSLASMPLTKHLTVAIIDNNPALEREDNIRTDGPPDPRVSTVTPASISFFKDIGAWQYVQQHRHAYFDKMQVWDYTGLGYTRYSARDADKDVLGCVVENKVLQKSLLSCIKEHKDFQKTIYPSRLNSMTLSPRLSSLPENISSGTPNSTRRGLAELELSDGNTLHANLVVGADGSKSRVRELAGFKTTGWKYSQSAVICTVEHLVENHCAWQRFLPAGPIALLPIGDNFSNIVWTMNPQESSNHALMSESDFVNAVNYALDHGHGPRPESKLFGNGNILSWFRADATASASEPFEVPPKVVKLASERKVFPLSLMHANTYVSKRIALIGDSAHTVHPLAGQGVNLGFGDAYALSKVIAEGVAVGSDIGDVSLLKKYEADRKPANIAMMALLDGFQKAYSVDFGPLNVLRAAAFHGAQYISPLKRNIISFASGEQGLPLFS